MNESRRDYQRENGTGMFIHPPEHVCTLKEIIPLGISCFRDFTSAPPVVSVAGLAKGGTLRLR
jgi:hypothetical protein